MKETAANTTSHVNSTKMPDLITTQEARKLLRAALKFDVEFAEEFKILRPYLGRIVQHWPSVIQKMVTEHQDNKGKFTAGDKVDLDRLMAAYIHELRSGRFYEKFFKSVENLAGFFIERGVPNSWLIGAFMDVFHEAQLEIFFDKEARKGRIVVAALRCLLKIMTLTIQILNAASFAKPGRQSVVTRTS